MPTSVTGARAQAMVLALIKLASRAKPVQIAAIQEATGLSARDVKGIVHDLRYSAIDPPIGSLRDASKGGYFLCRTPDDIEATCRPLESQALNMLRLVANIRRSTPARVVAEQLGLFEAEAIPEPSEAPAVALSDTAVDASKEEARRVAA